MAVTRRHGNSLVLCSLLNLFDRRASLCALARICWMTAMILEVNGYSYKSSHFVYGADDFAVHGMVEERQQRVWFCALAYGLLRVLRFCSNSSSSR